MTDSINFNLISKYFSEKIKTFGSTPRGADWNSITSQEIRFEQLIKLIDADKPYSLIDYGSGFGSLFDYLIKKKHQLDYVGFDIVEEMVNKGKELHQDYPHCSFTSKESDLPLSTYVIASGIFNIKLEATENDWTDYIIRTLKKMDSLCKQGFSFNLLTKYSDPPLMRPDLFYADPCFYFDYCKQHFSKDVALLHDYGLYDFSIIVRKQVA